MRSGQVEAAGAGRPLLPVEPSSDDGRALRLLNEARHATIEKIISDLRVTLSLTGVEQFAKHLQTVKRKMKVIPD